MSAACFTLQDAIGDVWSIKIVTNSSSKVGCPFDTKLKMMDILNAEYSPKTLHPYSSYGLFLLLWPHFPPVESFVAFCLACI
jgi:hypothetical protein